MQPAVLESLEFDRIRLALAREASTPLGRARALALEPATAPDDVRRLLDLTIEAAAFAKASGRLWLDSPEDLEDVLAHLGVDDEPLAPLHLLGLARFVASVGNLVDRVRRSGSPLLCDLVEPVTSFDAEVAAVRRAIQPAGDVADDASPALREIRDGLRRQRARLRTVLEGLTRGRDHSKYLQDQVITDRNGRYVVVVRSEHRDAIPGIVHGASASGASLYVEPLTTVPLNNDIVALSAREHEEIRRILIALTDAFRSRGADLDALLDAAAALDELGAKAGLSARLDGVAPDLAPDGRLELRGARHPLLIPGVRDLLDDAGAAAGPAVVVPSDLLVVPPTGALVISGPNTGGKTVALKAFGLLSLMAQAGLLIPVERGSRLTPFATVFADIGDDQSIAASLSTFSAHIANLVAIDRELELPALILLDEVGGGTDPVEGGALGAAVIDHFRRRGALVVATTHDDALKSFAATTDGVAAAAFGFDAETFAPTYTLRYGAPGRSLALEVARRLGMRPEIVADADRRRSGRETLLAAHLAQVDRELAEAERERRQAREERAALAGEREALIARESRLAEREALLKKRADDRLAERLREARAEVDAVVSRLKSKADTLADQAAARAKSRAPVLSTGEVGGLRAEARSALDEIESATLGELQPSGDDAALAEPPAEGDRVWVTAVGAEGIVRGAGGRQIDVEVRGKRLRVALDSLRRLPAGGGAAGRGGGATESRAGRGVTTPARAGVVAAPVKELVLIGSTVDDAIARIEKFVDDALLSDDRRLRIVHGHGTGRLREAVRAFAKAHPLVAAVAPAAAHEGGDGATIVELKD